MNYSFKTISKKVMGDLHTPVSIYLKVRDIYPESALLESSDFHGNENSLSFIALRPLASIGINNGECTATFPDETREVTPLTEDYNVPEAMNAFLGRFKVEGADKKVCGLFGYTAFDAVRYFENIPVMEVHHEENDAPDMLYILYKYILVFNHFKNELTLVEMLQEDEASRLEEIETLIENRNFASYNFQTAGPETSPITGEEYKPRHQALPQGRCLPDRIEPSLRATVQGRRLQGVPGSSQHQSLSLFVLFRFRRFPYLRLFPRDALQGNGQTRQHRPDRRDRFPYR
jgi:anthranilate synthase component 1